MDKVKDNRSGGWRQVLDAKLHQLSIKELTALVIKLVFVGFMLLLIVYGVANRVTSHYQDLFTSQVLPMTLLQRDIEENLVNYALLEGEILQGDAVVKQRDEAKALNIETSQNLLRLHALVKGDEGLLKIMSELNANHDALAINLVKMQASKVDSLNNSIALGVFKNKTLDDFENLIVLREALSGKIALIDAKNRLSKTTGNNFLVRADLILGTKMAELASNVSILMYVDSVDQLNDINSNQLSQNLEQVGNAIKTMIALAKPMPSLQSLYQLSEQMQLGLEVVQKRLLGEASLTVLIQEKISTKVRLENVSAKFQTGLDVIENDLKDMAALTAVIVSKAVSKNETISWVSFVVLLMLGGLVILVLEVLVSAISRQISKPIDLLKATMTRLTHGELSVRLPVDESISSEFTTIWQDFNLFAQKNERAINEQDLVFDNADIGIGWLKDRKYMMVNNKLLSLFGYEEADIVGRNSSFMYVDEEAYLKIGKDGYQALLRGDVYITEAQMRRADGGVFWCKMTGKSTGPTGDKSSIWLHEDITERKLAEEKLYQLANFDSLTTLPNRDLFNIYLDEAIIKAKRRNVEFAVLFVDLDRFKHINDSMGHEAGDMVLREMSSRMKSVVRASDTLARLGGDEFTIILDDVHDDAGIERVTQNILDELARVMVYKEKEIFTGGSIGISRYPQDGTVRSELLSAADSAMYQAKESGRNRYGFYSAHLGEVSDKFIELSHALKHAVEHNEFELHYQPKINMKTRQIIGAEALIRWNRPGVGLVSPFEFIPVLEESGLMVQVGEWVIFETCRAISTWNALGYYPGKIAVNLSERQFGDKALLDSISRALEETGVSACSIELEITESLMMDDSELTMEILNGIKNLGIDIAMDDFGTGYSSLAYLKRFPIDILKIDRAFVMDITEDEDDAVIVEAIIAMAKQLKLTTVAEGIETEEQYKFLGERGCEIGQGYLFSKPVPFDGMLELYAKGDSLDLVSTDTI